MIVITCVSNIAHRGYCDGLMVSCRHFNIHLETLLHDGAWHSHRLKDDYVRNFLRTLPNNEIVLFTDAYDTVFLTDETEILSKFNQAQTPVLFSAEVNCFPYETLSALHPPCKSKFRYLNSGGFIGRVGDILALFVSAQASTYFSFSTEHLFLRLQSKYGKQCQNENQRA